MVGFQLESSCSCDKQPRVWSKANATDLIPPSQACEFPDGAYQADPKKNDSKRCVTCRQQCAALCCAACKAVYYCSRACQRMDWKSSHRNVCPSRNTHQLSNETRAENFFFRLGDKEHTFEYGQELVPSVFRQPFPSFMSEPLSPPRFSMCVCMLL